MALFTIILITVVSLTASCGFFKISIRPGTQEAPFKEFTVDGRGRGKDPCSPDQGVLKRRTGEEPPWRTAECHPGVGRPAPEGREG